ncbi:MAG: hypothetical protein ABEK12_01210, partial [Candidatus Nanohaloarchaea archaeon]
EQGLWDGRLAEDDLDDGIPAAAERYVADLPAPYEIGDRIGDTVTWGIMAPDEIPAEADRVRTPAMFPALGTALARQRYDDARTVPLPDGDEEETIAAGGGPATYMYVSGTTASEAGLTYEPVADDTVSRLAVVDRDDEKGLS